VAAEVLAKVVFVHSTVYCFYAVVNTWLQDATCTALETLSCSQCYFSSLLTHKHGNMRFQRCLPSATHCKQ